MKLSSTTENLIKLGFIVGKMSEVNTSTSVRDIQRMIIICSAGSLKINFLLRYLLDFSFSYCLDRFISVFFLLVQEKYRT